MLGGAEEPGTDETPFSPLLSSDRGENGDAHSESLIELRAAPSQATATIGGNPKPGSVRGSCFARSGTDRYS